MGERALQSTSSTTVVQAQPDVRRTALNRALSSQAVEGEPNAMLDTLIKGGTVVDGTGALRSRADIGIKDGRIVGLGDLDSSARQTIDATDLIVAPGFIDVHTHLDAQVFWDTTLSPSPLHGVTTVLGGNCGFSIAPLSQQSAEYVMRTLARVEGMPLSALESGVPWSWSSTDEYLTLIDGTLSVNAGFMVGHTAIRRIVMGADASMRAATPQEIEAMKQLLSAGLRAGGIGFSSSWGGAHQDANGDPVPSRHATIDELVALAEVCGGFPGTSLEFIPSGPGAFSDDEREVMVAMSSRAGRPLNWNLIAVDSDNADHQLSRLGLSDDASRRGGKVVGLAMPVDFPARFSFLTGFVLDAIPGWRYKMALPIAERLRLLQDPVERQILDESAQSPHGFAHVSDWAEKVISETFTPETKRFEGRNVGDIARERRVKPFDALLDIVCADGLRTTFTRTRRVPTAADWAARARVWGDERAVIGGSDAGAHSDFVAYFNYATVFLQDAVREHQLFSLEQAVRMLTHVPASLYGLKDRGLLAEGACADIVIFDESQVGSEAVTTRFDLPAGAGRLYAAANGIERVLVNGEEIVTGRSFTMARPGRVLRSGSDTYTPSIA
ncbi:MAG: amidohydrolase family protein [Ilumatobacteraceae bacterium]